jgi:hypothetical protein
LNRICSVSRSGIEGTLAAGGTVTAATPFGTGGWLNLQSFRVFATGDGFFAFGTSAVELDNVVVNVVPIPAAVWLFASALGLLGVRRAARNAGFKRN